MRNWLVCSALLAGFALLAIPAIADDDDRPSRAKSFIAGLGGYQEVPAVSTAARGRFAAKLDATAGMLSYRLRYGNLEGGDVRFAHIHLGRPGTNGGVIAWLCDNSGNGPTGTPACPMSGEVSGMLDADDVVGPGNQGIDPGELRELVRAMRSHSTYVNVHTLGFPGGEIRGQIVGARPGKAKEKDDDD